MGKLSRALAMRLMACSLLGVSAAWGHPDAEAPTTPNRAERAFLGRLVSTTLIPVSPTHAEPNGVLVISLTCAVAKTTYEVLGAPSAGKRIVVHSSLGEWCDLPAGMHGNPVLVDATWQDGGWWATRVLDLDATHDGQYVLVVAQFPKTEQTICGIRLEELEEPLDPLDEVVGNARDWQPSETARMVARHAARVGSDGTLSFTRAVPQKRLLAAMAASACSLER